ncbi:MFS transporter [Phytomonospora sp. NPDC050363]|uniref:MFS transporter n=1 Tax=Phytomonospora sp. NPDC050363 TaxID=3155642 RepID=UPI003400780D
MTTPTLTRTETHTTTLAIAAAAPLLVLSVYVVPLITLPETAAGVGAGVTEQTWILNANPLGLAALLLVTGSLADNLGRRRLFAYGAAALAATSAVGALATTPALLIAARIGQGAAGAALLAASLGIVGHVFVDPMARAKATGMWAAALGAGLAAGPPLAGALTLLNWRAVYWVPVAGGIALVIASRALPESRAGHRSRTDLAGMALLAAALVALLSAVTLGRTGWTSPEVLGLLAATVVFTAAFALVESRTAEPMLDLALFRQPLFLLATGGALLNGLAIIGVGSVTATVWQHAHGFSAFDTSLMFTLWASASLAAALTARRIPIRPSRLLALGYLLSSTNLLLLGTGAAGGWVLWRVLLGFGLSGIGAGLVNAASARLAIDSVPPHRAGMGSGANNTARYIGSSVGVAVAISTLSSLGWDAGMDRMLIVGVAMLLAGAVIAFAAKVRAGTTP